MNLGLKFRFLSIPGDILLGSLNFYKWYYLMTNVYIVLADAVERKEVHA